MLCSFANLPGGCRHAATCLACLRPQRVFQEVTGKLKGFGGPPRAVRDALEEARLAVEEVVVPQGQPMELLPRPGDVLEMQALLVKRELGLSYERVGEGPKARLRVLPVGAGAESNASGADEEA